MPNGRDQSATRRSTTRAAIRAGAGCRSFEPCKVRCGVGSVFLNIDLGDGNDSSILQAPLSGTVFGGRGDDTFHAGLIPGGSNVTYDGGDVCFPTGCIVGKDTISYAGADRRVSVTQDRRENDGRQLLDRDFIESDVETIIGSRFDDIVAGSSVANTILGGEGDDHLNAGAGNDIFDEGFAANGSDTLVGAAGFDQVGYGLRDDAVRVSLDGRADDGADFGNERDNAGADLESVFDSRSHDSIFGNEQDNDRAAATATTTSAASAATTSSAATRGATASGAVRATTRSMSSTARRTVVSPASAEPTPCSPTPSTRSTPIARSEAARPSAPCR